MSTIHTYLPGILVAYTTYAIVTVSPGPAVMATIGTSMSYGRQAGIALALGIVTGSLCWGVLAAAGLSALLASYAGAMEVIRVLGGLYLLWLAYRAFRSAATRQELTARVIADAPISRRAYFFRGWGVHMTNPKAIMGWIAIISLGLSPGSPPWVAGVILLGTAVFGVTFYTLAALAFSTSTAVRVYGKCRRAIEATLGVFFVFAGARMLTAR